MANDDDGLWYFAYGANMCRDVLARRELVTLHSEAGRLPGYRLTFDKPGIWPLEPGFATIEPDASTEVHGVLHRVRSADLGDLDRFEGSEYGHINVSVFGAGVGHVPARAYVAREPSRGLIPSRRYVEVMVRGALEHQVPMHHIEWLRAHPQRHIPVLSESMKLYVVTLEGLLRLWKRR